MIDYKVGDLVVIIPREGNEEDYPGVFIDSQAILAGKVFAIERIGSVSDKNWSDCKFFNGDSHRYFLRSLNDDSPEGLCYHWSSSMFKKLEFIKVGDFTGKVVFFNNKYWVSFPNITELECIKSMCPWFKETAMTLGGNTNAIFPTFKDPGAFMVFIDSINFHLNKNKQSQNKQNNDEVRLQNSKASFVRGSVPEGSAICGRRRKAAIVVGHISNQARYL